MRVRESYVDHLGLRLKVYHWSTEPTAIAAPALLIVHGLGEHAARYEVLAEYFAERGYHVFGFDHQGHGRSDGGRGVIQSWPSLVSEINTLRAYIQRELEQGTPITLWGHSLGALLSLDYLTGRPEAASLPAAILTAPPLQLAYRPSPALVRAGRLLSGLTPDLTIGNGLDPRSLSRDAGVVSLYMVDPLNHDRMSLRLAAQMLTAGTRLSASPQAVPCPLLLMNGSADRISDFEGARKFARQAVGEVTFRVWEGLFHELHQEPEQEEVFAFAKTWLDNLPPSNL